MKRYQVSLYLSLIPIPCGLGMRPVLTKHKVTFWVAIFQAFADRIRLNVCDTVVYVNKAIKAKKKIIVEGANAAMLDIDFGIL